MHIILNFEHRLVQEVHSPPAMPQSLHISPRWLVVQYYLYYALEYICVVLYFRSTFVRMLVF